MLEPSIPPSSAMDELNLSQQRTLALAAVFQAAKLVHLFATQGAAALLIHGEAYDYLLAETLSTRPLAKRFQQITALRSGLSSLERCLVHPYQSVPETKQLRKNPILMYATSLLVIERKVFGRDSLARVIDKQLPTLQHRRQFFAEDLRHSALLAGMASLYLETAGTLNMRLNVRGQQTELTNAANIDRIRACLLTGLQAAHTWHALGGRRWRFVLGRRQVMLDLRELAMLDRAKTIKTP